MQRLSENFREYKTHGMIGIRMRSVRLHYLMRSAVSGKEHAIDSRSWQFLGLLAIGEVRELRSHECKKLLSGAGGTVFAFMFLFMLLVCFEMMEMIMTGTLYIAWRDLADFWKWINIINVMRS